MKWPVSYRRAAITDVVDAAGWLEQQRPGMSKLFVVAIESVVVTIREEPHRYAAASNGIRMAPVPGFSYVVIYRLESDRFRVIAVFHTSRDPAVWQPRT